MGGETLSEFDRRKRRGTTCSGKGAKWVGVEPEQINDGNASPDRPCGECKVL